MAVAALAAVAQGCDDTPGTIQGPVEPLPELASETVLHDGLIFEASATVLTVSPTRIRVVATLTNPTDETVIAHVLLGRCQAMAVAYWAANPEGRIVEPLDGWDDTIGTAGASCLITAGAGALPIAPGERQILVAKPEFTLSEVLGDQFRPGRFVISALVIDDFPYEVLAFDGQISD